MPDTAFRRGLTRLRSHAAAATYALPGGQRLVAAARYGIGGTLDAVDALTGRREPLIPPRRLRFVGQGDFIGVGDSFLRHFRDLADLQPDEAVLDIGCGVGRMAIPLTRYLGPAGSYRGFDVVPAGVNWCRRNITPRHPNFQFTVIDLQNKRYNPHGALDSSGVTFPYESESFDFAFATSVFTHMLTEEVDRYVGETARVLRRGGRALFTFYLLPSGRPRAPGDATPEFSFDIHGDGYRTINERVPEVAVAYAEDDVRRMLERRGFALERPIEYGCWATGRGLSHQDIVVATRR